MTAFVIDRARFFAKVRADIFGGRLSGPQVSGMEAILDGFGQKGFADPRWLAYMLATTHHETAATMQPVRETLAASDAEAVARLERAWRGGRLPTVTTPYWRFDANGQTWLGRGFVQLTHKINYERMSAVTGIDLVAAPERAMELSVATTILMTGMREGSFTGRRLAQHFASGEADWVGARRIINGLDRAEKIAATGRAFDAAIRAAALSGRAPDGIACALQQSTGKSPP